MERRQLEMFPELLKDQHKATSTFSSNMKLPIHRWFRYSAGFSAQWAGEFIRREKEAGRTHILDPFSGSGTVLIEAELAGVESIGLEAHPFVARVTEAKLNWNLDLKAFNAYAHEIIRSAKQPHGESRQYPSLILKCYPPENLTKLDALRQAITNNTTDEAFSNLAWLALAAILRECSPAGTAPWQYVLPKKSKATVADPFEAFSRKVAVMKSDIAWRQDQASGPKPVQYIEDARTCASVPNQWADLVITSPPYANNYDYADATRLEMSFFGQVDSWGDLHDAVRKYLIRSCTQHVSKDKTQLEAVLSDPLLEPIHSELVAVCRQLEKERENHGGRKAYHTMVAAYFSDLAQTWQSLRRVTQEDALVCFVIGDSAPYGIHVPVDRWLGELAIAAGFKNYQFKKIRDRNIKWKNRKHDVPLHEGHLIVRG